ncbi:DUF2259 domain-containing protein [Treponema socranskii]|jgi:hypothetical protein|uniref:DUF2259 domain-containing protein n=1 Tax=Treponema socranskii TaxID=53419 RepID=UPI0020A4FD2F|nr:DUF2259 domain-containing protein [Treponema socranskii]UTD03276.1 DUF2259 domain-containing protein [Treponema socranskii subsp. buccale]
MKKIIAGGLIFALCLYCALAGDAAVFVDAGFSSDGSIYLFGQYGKTDKSFRGWAEIYTVDVAKNDFVKGGTYKIQPSSVTAGKSGREVYDSLAAKSYFDTKKYNCTPASPDQILYICGDENKDGSDEIVFKDFAGKLGSKSTYRIRLIPTVRGTGENAKSSFYILMEKLDENGSVVSRQKIGSPDVVRKGVTSYKIEKILCNKSGDGIAFIVAKTMEDKTGVLIRYMAETAKLFG